MTNASAHNLCVLVFIGTRRKDYIDDYEDRLPQRGERVDSISYYTRDLVDMNEKISSVQEEKKKVAMLGNEKVSASERIASKLVRNHLCSFRHVAINYFHNIYL